MPAYCVGRKTAEAAEDAGLSVADIGSGGLQEVLDRVQVAHSRVLRLAGRKRTPLSIPDGIRMQEKVVYASEPLPMSGELARLLRSEAVVLLHSGEAARHFAETCPDACRAHVRLVAIGPRVAERAGDGWHSVRSACQPSEDALLALAEELCKDEGGSERGRPSN
ncbi:hypothetical protein GCM10011371_30240 [Novosphingobium marinum]|nr:hypothetical protein GCM10011371_30240 [Novosphingobium marinum]